ncbi:TonB family protein [Aliikangiella sp. IMCC44653]
MHYQNIVRKSFIATVFLAALFLLYPINHLKANETVTLSDGSQLKLIGIGMFQELRNDIYLGALYGPQSVDQVELLLDQNVASRMSLRFVSSYSNRKLARHWKERMAMNNSRSEWQPFTREIVGFSRLFKRQLDSSDEINIDYVPGVGTQVFINGTLFDTIEKPGFMGLLLNVWLGNIPPTKAFKSAIRGNVDTTDTYLAQFAALQPVAGKFDADKPSNETQVAKVEQTKPQAEKPEPKKAQPEKVVSKKPEPKKPDPEPVKVNQPKTVDNSAKASPQQEKIANNKGASSNSKPAIETPKQPPKREPVKVAKIEPPIEDLIDVDLITGSYTRDLINTIKEYQSYPREALREQEEGDVTAMVTINTSGEVEEIKLIERSGSRILDRAVTRIIRKAAPFQAIPTELEKSEFTFEVAISFKL